MFIEINKNRLNTVVFHGSKDVIIPTDAGRHIARVPDAELLILEGMGHVPTMTRPQEVAAAIERRFPPSG